MNEPVSVKVEDPHRLVYYITLTYATASVILVHANLRRRVEIHAGAGGEVQMVDADHSDHFADLSFTCGIPEDDLYAFGEVSKREADLCLMRRSLVKPNESRELYSAPRDEAKGEGEARP